MKTYSIKNTVELDAPNKKIRVIKKAYDHLMKKVRILDLKINDYGLVCSYEARGITGQMCLNDVTNLIK